ncbi:MAG: riboflavin biosynthesis protein RibF [Atopobiaceae bacterium]|nr:riboflavin biosynthesis protein RibF [Atopobiaceae bacterium]
MNESMSDLLRMGGPQNPMTPLGPLTRELAFEAAKRALMPGPELPDGHTLHSGTIWRLSEQAPKHAGDKAVLVIGAFDGVHLGHQELIAQAKADARQLGCPLVVVTFSPDPDEAIPNVVPAKRLLVQEDRLRHLAACEPDAILALTFNDELRMCKPDVFVKDFLFDHMQPVSIHVGEDFRFGVKNSGNTETLAELGRELGFEVHPVHLLEHDDQAITATWIRTLLSHGNLSQAWKLLGRPHFVRGCVEHGRGEGSGMGFPTANVACLERLCMPHEGVYAGFVHIDNRLWPAAINVGAPRSFSGPRDAFLEANLIGFSGDIYESALEVVFIEWLRAAKSFSSLEELERTVLANIAWTERYLGSEGMVIT